MGSINPEGKISATHLNTCLNQGKESWNEVERWSSTNIILIKYVELINNSRLMFSYNLFLMARHLVTFVTFLKINENYYAIIHYKSI